MEDWKNTKCGTCIIQRQKPICNSCMGHQFYKPMSNADKIRNMNDEELAEFLLKVNTANENPCMIDGGNCKWEDYPTRDKGCKDCFLEYLRKEVKGSE